jgi:hypothetical protein
MAIRRLSEAIWQEAFVAEMLSLLSFWPIREYICECYEHQQHEMIKIRASVIRRVVMLTV